MLKKAPMKFDKELFKGTVLNNIKNSLPQNAGRSYRTADFSGSILCD